MIMKKKKKDYAAYSVLPWLSEMNFVYSDLYVSLLKHEAIKYISHTVICFIFSSNHKHESNFRILEDLG